MTLAGEAIGFKRLAVKLGAPRINVVSLDPDLRSTFDQLAALTELGAQRNIETDVEPVPGLTIGDLPEPQPPADDWVTVTVRTSALNHHDLWSLRGVGLDAKALPMILGCDGTAVDDDGNEFVIYPVVPGTGVSKGYSVLSEIYPGTFAERIADLIKAERRP